MLNSFHKSLNSHWVGMNSIQCNIKLDFSEGAKNGGTTVHTGKFNLCPCNQFSADNIKNRSCLQKAMHCSGSFGSTYPAEIPSVF